MSRKPIQIADDVDLALERGSIIVGNAGEYFVLAELSRRGWTAAPTPRNSRAFDILATKNGRQLALRVKTKTSAATGFRWNAKKDGTVFAELSEASDFLVLVDMGCVDDPPRYWIVPTHFIYRCLVEDFQEWVSTPGFKGRQRAKDNKVRFMHLPEQNGRPKHGYERRLSSYFNNWALLETSRPAGSLEDHGG